MRNKYIIISAIAVSLSLPGAVSCNKFLDVVPDDGLATIEKTFNLRSSAISYLATCYSYLPKDGITGGDPAMLGGDEMWDIYNRVVTNTSARVPGTYFNIARGLMSANSVYANDWIQMYQGIRCCDILCENMDRVPDMSQMEKDQWKAEAKFLKAFFHFNLVRKWGPVPIIRESLPINSDMESVRVYRDNIDDCFDFILGLMDEALPDLPLVNQSSEEYGRITKPICASVRARIATYAASPLFNGNEQEAALVDSRGNRLFPSKSSDQKAARWQAAMDYCKEALQICSDASMRLFDSEIVKLEFPIVKNSKGYNDTLVTDLTLRNAFYRRWNSEMIWGNTQTTASPVNIFQKLCMPTFSGYKHMLGGYRFLGVPLKIAEQFYTRNGLPIRNDVEWAGKNVYALKEGTPDHAYYLKEGYTTIEMNFNREPRYYSSLGFDGGTWLSLIPGVSTGLQPESMHVVYCRLNGVHGKSSSEYGPNTGIFPKKLFPYECVSTANDNFTSWWFPWPTMRLSDLYLLYAECINEVEGPNGFHSKELFDSIDAIRKRAGIPGVKEAWDNYSNNPGYYGTQIGMRAIIHQERLIELAFESQRFWDIRRWMEAPAEYQKGIYGFHITSMNPEDYYVKTFLAEQNFGLKDYFWPIPASYIELNRNLVQNLGW
jgi:hypothetical protein